MWEDFDTIMKKMHIQLQREMEQAFGRKALTHKGRQVMPYRTPATELYQTENNIIATFELPGVDKEDIELNVVDDAVEIKVEKKASKETKGKTGYSYAESSRCFYRAFKLPSKVNPDKIEAYYKNGVLRVEMPKKKQIEHKGSKIQIK